MIARVAIILVFLLSSAPEGAATEFMCGDDYITFETKGETTIGPSHIVTVQKRMILIVIAGGTQPGAAVVIGRDGVPESGTNHITQDTYRHFMRCLD